MITDKTNSISENYLHFDLFKAELMEAQARWNCRHDELNELINSKPLLLFGFGGKGQSLAHQIKNLIKKEITVYDVNPEKRTLAKLQGFTVIEKFNPEMTENWATILGGCQVQSEQKTSVPANHIYYQEAVTLFNTPVLANLGRDYGAFIIPNSQNFYTVYKALHRDSRPRFLSILKSRITSNPIDLINAKSHNLEMWLDIPKKYKNRPYSTVLDIGAFDGDTLRYFRNRFGCDRGIAVEANTKLFDSISTVGKSYPRGIEIMPMAAWSKKTRLRFDMVRFGMIQVTESESGSLDAAPIDEYVTEQIDFLKMDIEGAESHALEGCKNILSRWQPDLAIAAYHKPEDFVNLYSQIRSAGYTASQFEWHIGHYSDVVDDSIFYVIRK